MRQLSGRYDAASEIGESARRGWAHGLLQTSEDIVGANAIISEIPFSDAREALRMNLMLIAARKGININAREIVYTITNVVRKSPPFSIHNAHSINNGTFALHEARDQEDVRPYLSLLNGFMELAVGLYASIDMRKNHLAGCLFRLSFIAEADDWIDGALLYIGECIQNWQTVLSSQDEERFRNNLENARGRYDHLLDLKRSSVT
ncbi:hypothetical protein IIA94_00730 [Patescibacteria group bacterium]|nr:hypothetical protein [Patescibacteria group bacterium]